MNGDVGSRGEWTTAACLMFLNSLLVTDPSDRVIRNALVGDESDTRPHEWLPIDQNVVPLTPVNSYCRPIFLGTWQADL